MKKRALFLAFETFLAVMFIFAFYAFCMAADAAPTPSPAIPGWMSWMTGSLGLIGVGVTFAGHSLARFLLVRNQKLTPNTPLGMGALLFFWLVWKVIYACQLYNVAPPVDLFNKPADGPTSTDTAAEAAGQS